MEWIMFFFGFTTAITVYSCINTVVHYKAAKKREEMKKAESDETEAEFLKALESAFGIVPKDEKKEEAKKIIKLVKEDDDDEDPTIH